MSDDIAEAIAAGWQQDEDQRFWRQLRNGDPIQSNPALDFWPGIQRVYANTATDALNYDRGITVRTR